MGIIAQELVHAERVVETIEDLELAKDDIGDDHPHALERIQKVQHRQLEALPAIRVRVAAELLGLSVPTIHKWTDLGLLEEVDDGIRKVTTRSVRELRPRVLELRELGMKRNLLEAVLARLDDEETFADPDLRTSIAEMERGDLVDITPEDE